MIIMAFLIKRPAIFIFLLFSINFLNTEGQTTEIYKVKEQEADSLALLEKHEDAVNLLLSVIDDYGKELQPQELSRIEYKIGYSLMHAGLDAEAMKYFRKVIRMSKDPSLKDMLNDAMTGLGKTFEYLGKHDSAFYWYLQAYKQVGESGDTLRKARSARNMAQLLRVLNRFDEAQYYCLQAVKLIPGINDYKVVANIYNETAYLFELADILDSAAYYYLRLIDLSIASGYQKGESAGYSNLASVFKRQKRYPDALAYEMKGIEIDKKINDAFGLMNSYIGLSETYLLTGEYDKALRALDEASELCDTVWLPQAAGIKLGYYNIFKAEKKYAKALEYYEAYNRLEGQINQAESRRQVTELLAHFETEKKEQQIKLLEQANALKGNRIKLLLIMISAVVLLSIAGGIISAQVIKRKNERITGMILEMRNYMLMLKNNRLIGNHSPGENKRTEFLKEQFSFTHREAEIMNLIIDGLSNEEIAAKLFVSANTIKFHIKNIYLKLDVKNRVQALIKTSFDDQSDNS